MKFQRLEKVVKVCVWGCLPRALGDDLEIPGLGMFWKGLICRGSRQSPEVYL